MFCVSAFLTLLPPLTQCEAYVVSLLTARKAIRNRGEKVGQEDGGVVLWYLWVVGWVHLANPFLVSLVDSNHLQSYKLVELIPSSSFESSHGGRTPHTTESAQHDDLNNS